MSLMTSVSEFDAAVNSHRIVEKVASEAALKLAAAKRQEAQAFAAAWAGDGPGVAETRRRIIADAESAAAALEAQAIRHKQRARTAKRDHVLDGPEEWHDPALAMDPKRNELVAAARHHRRLATEPME